MTEFIDELKQLFPELKEEFEGYEQNVNEQTGTIKDAINEAGTDGTIDFMAEVLALLGDLIKNADDELKKVISVSILEHLDIDRESLEQMPETLREVYNEMLEQQQDEEIE